MSQNNLFSKWVLGLKTFIILSHSLPPPLHWPSPHLSSHFSSSFSYSYSLYFPSHPPLLRSPSHMPIVCIYSWKRIFRFSHSIYAQPALTHCALMFLSGKRSKSGREDGGGMEGWKMVGIWGKGGRRVGVRKDKKERLEEGKCRVSKSSEGEV